MVPVLVICIFGLIGACAPESPTGEKKNTWALLVASTGLDVIYMKNYALQANICHAYHTMLATGIPADRIIVMLPDDAVNSPDNPYKGKLINRPNGKDVYAGVKIDYRGQDITPKNFLNVLSGNKEAMAGKGTGRVIESDENAELIVYVNDHGGPQCIIFGETVLHSNQLHETITNMHQEKKYKKMFFFLGTCFSGSMFEGLYPADLNVYAMTSSRSDEESYFCDCSSWICLSDFFTAAWIGFLDSQPKGTPLTFDHIFEVAKSDVLKSNVSHYGNLKLGSDKIVANEIGATPVPMDSHCLNYVSKIPVHRGDEDRLRWLVDHAKDEDSRKTAQSNLDSYLRKEDLIVELERRLLLELSIWVPEIVHYKGLVLPSNPESRECYQDIATHFNEHCSHLFRFSKTLAMFINACVIAEDLSGFKIGMTNVCEPFKDFLKSSA